MLGDITGDVRYVTDEIGKRQEVILPFRVWRGITEELEALREKHEILTDLQQACREVKRQESDDLDEQSIEGFLDEL